MKNYSKGMTTLEAALGLLLMATMGISVFAVTDAINTGFNLSAAVNQIVTDRSIRAYALNTDQDKISLVLNKDKLEQLLQEMETKARQFVSQQSLPYYIEIGYAQVPIDQNTGKQNGAISFLNNQIRKSQTFSPPDSKSERVNVVRLIGDFAQARTIATPLSLPQGELKFIPSSVLVSLAVAVDLNQSFVGTIWEQLTGSSVLTASKTTVLRGEVE